MAPESHQNYQVGEMVLSLIARNELALADLEPGRVGRRTALAGCAARLGKKSMVGWIGAVRPSRRPLSRPPQDEELSKYYQSVILILRSA